MHYRSFLDCRFFFCPTVVVTKHFTRNTKDGFRYFLKPNYKKNKVVVMLTRKNWI